MLSRRGFMLVPVLALAACVPDGHGVPQDTVRQYHVAGVELRGAEAIYSWPAQEKIALGQGKLSTEEQSQLAGRAAGSFPPLREQMDKALHALFAAQASNQLAPALKGSKPATLVVNVRVFDSPSVARKVLVGGHARKQFDIDLIDKASGTTIVRYQGLQNQNFQLQGLASIAEAAVQGDNNDPASEMVRTELANYRDWLIAAKP